MVAKFVSTRRPTSPALALLILVSVDAADTTQDPEAIKVIKVVVVVVIVSYSIMAELGLIRLILCYRGR
jgi:hypothetical protein